MKIIKFIEEPLKKIPILAETEVLVIGGGPITYTLTEMNTILNENGILILEQRNFDKLLKVQRRFFPVSYRENEVFFYVLDFLPSEVIFNVINTNTKDKTFQTYTTKYNALKKDKLKELLHATGFEIIDYYEDHKFNKFNIDTSDSLIILCNKKR